MHWNWIRTWNITGRLPTDTFVYECAFYVVDLITSASDSDFCCHVCMCQKFILNLHYPDSWVWFLPWLNHVWFVLWQCRGNFIICYVVQPRHWQAGICWWPTVRFMLRGASYSLSTSHLTAHVVDVWGGHCDSHKFAAQSFWVMWFPPFAICSTDCTFPCPHIENGSLNALQYIQKT